MRILYWLSVALLCAACVNDRADCNFPFHYSFYEHTVAFPMSVDEAAKRYGLVKTKYSPLFNNTDPEKTDVSIYYPDSFSFARYAPRTAKATQPYYNSDIYAIGIHLRDPTLSLERVLEKLSKDFKKEFVERQNRFGRRITYYELAINDCEMVTVNDEPGYLVGETYAIHVVFTYKLIPPEVEQFMETETYFWYDD